MKENEKLPPPGPKGGLKKRVRLVADGPDVSPTGSGVVQMFVWVARQRPDLVLVENLLSLQEKQTQIIDWIFY